MKTITWILVHNFSLYLKGCFTYIIFSFHCFKVILKNIKYTSPACEVFHFLQFDSEVQDSTHHKNQVKVPNDLTDAWSGLYKTKINYLNKIKDSYLKLIQINDLQINYINKPYE